VTNRWRNKAFGSALDFVWGSRDNSNDFAVRESATSVKIFKNFVEKSGGLDVTFAADGLSGGVLLGVKGQGGVSFYDWASGGLVRRIEVDPKQVYWSESGELVALACEDTFYVLRYDSRSYVAAVQAGEVEDDGVEAAFEVVADITQRFATPLPFFFSLLFFLSKHLYLGELLTFRSVRTGIWVGDCFFYTNSTNRLEYLVGDKTYLVSHFDQPMYILGYIQRDSRIYLAE